MRIFGSHSSSPLTAGEKKLLKPAPVGASAAELTVRLDRLQALRTRVVRRMRAPMATALDRARHQAELVAISAALEGTMLRLRAGAPVSRILAR